MRMNTMESKFKSKVFENGTWKPWSKFILSDMPNKAFQYDCVLSVTVEYDDGSKIKYKRVNAS